MKKYRLVACRGCPDEKSRAQETQKAASLPAGKPQLQRREKPQSINALNALRDGASCSESLG
nr:hypothetical protein [uncultured Sphingosinicella sp.]